ARAAADDARGHRRAGAPGTRIRGQRDPWPAGGRSLRGRDGKERTVTDGLSRRAFLGTGTALAAHAALAHRATAQSPVTIPDAPVLNAIPTGIIGVGGRGTNVMRGVLQYGKVAAVCDTHAGRLQKGAEVAARDTPATFDDYRRVLDRKDIEAVVIATPPFLHAEMAVAALQAGKHVYCEKPVAITPESVQRVVKAARASDKVFITGQQLR